MELIGVHAQTVKGLLTVQEERLLLLCKVMNQIFVGIYDHRTNETTIIVYNIRHKFVAYTHSFRSGEKILHIASDGKTVFILTTTLNLYRYKEKSVSDRLDIMTRHNFHNLAITTAIEEQCTPFEITQLWKLYASYLLKKGNYDEAIIQYKETRTAP